MKTCGTSNITEDPLFHSYKKPYFEGDIKIIMNKVGKVIKKINNSLMI